MLLITMLTLLAALNFVLHGVVCLSVSDRWVGVYEDLQWKAELCCERPSPGLSHGAVGEDHGGVAGPKAALVNATAPAHPHPAHCLLRNATHSPNRTHPSPANCLDILCWLDGEKANLICNLKRQKALDTASDGLLRVSMRRSSRSSDTESDERRGGTAVPCAGDELMTCCLPLHSGDHAVSLAINVTDRDGWASSPEIDINLLLLRRPDPPVNLRYSVTTAGEVLFAWSPAQSGSVALGYELRYTSNVSLRLWQVIVDVDDPWVPLDDLSAGVRYTVQVRCRNQFAPGRWSDWSQPLSVSLDVSYIPAKIFTSPGTEVTVYGVFHNRSWNANRAVWLLNGREKVPESQYRVVNDRVSAVTLTIGQGGFEGLMCCQEWEGQYQCVIAYAKIYVSGMFDASITCQTNQNLRTDTMTCRWNKSVWAEVRFLYRWYDGPCEEMPNEEGTMSEMGGNVMSGLEECPDGPGDIRECTLRDLRLISCYKLWLEITEGEGRVRSLPVFITPIDYVKPAPPSMLEAVTLPNGTLRVMWRRPDLPAYDLQYELSYTALTEAVVGKAGPLLESWAEVLVPAPCVQYKVMVRCGRFNSTRYWSDWSEPLDSTIHDTRAPERGPDFWRILQKDPAKNQTSVTLLFKAVPPQDPPCCVEGLVIQHLASGRPLWSNKSALNPSHTFLWTEEVHTVTVLSRNSVGLSDKNYNMTMAHQPQRQCVQSFSAVANATCVTLSWTLLPGLPEPLSFVVEWPSGGEDRNYGASSNGGVEWVRVPSNERVLHLCRHFYGTEEFALYTVFAHGEGQPVKCMATRGDPAAYMLVLIITFLSVVLFVTLTISQNQIKKLMWKDVPNPNNCSWAQDLDFKKVDAMESLFLHPEGFTGCPLLLVTESISPAEIMEKPPLLTPEKDMEDLHRGLLHKSPGAGERSSSPHLMEDPVEPLSLEASSLGVTPETSGQLSVTYATVLLVEKPGLLHKQQESLSSSSDEGNFSANNSDISGSFPGGLWELGNAHGAEDANPRRSCSYNSVEEFSETSEQEDEALESRVVDKDLYYLGMEGEEDEGDDEEEDDGDDETEVPFGSEDVIVCIESDPLLGRRDSKTSNTSAVSQRAVPSYLPQFRTATSKPLREQMGDGGP